MILSTEQQRRLLPLAGLRQDTLLIHEIYDSVQGESTYVGLPCTFVRLTGCPLRCRWCDTPHAFLEGTPRTLDAVVADVARRSPAFVEVTGGEPLSQPMALPLLAALADLGRTVLLETSGAMSIADVDPRVVVILDVKCPGSGEEPSNDFGNLARLKTIDEIKFVIADRRDFDYAVDIIERFGLAGRHLLFSPVFGEMDSRMLVRWILENRVPARMQLQIHKHIWDPKERGV